MSLIVSPSLGRTLDSRLTWQLDSALVWQLGSQLSSHLAALDSRLSTRSSADVIPASGKFEPRWRRSKERGGSSRQVKSRIGCQSNLLPFSLSLLARKLDSPTSNISIWRLEVDHRAAHLAEAARAALINPEPLPSARPIDSRAQEPLIGLIHLSNDHSAPRVQSLGRDREPMTQQVPVAPLAPVLPAPQSCRSCKSRDSNRSRRTSFECGAQSSA